MEHKTGGLARYLLHLPEKGETLACPVSLLDCRLLKRQGTLVLWATFSFTNPGPDRASFAASCMARAYQGGLPLSPALVRGCPGFQGQSNLLPLLPGQTIPVHLAWQLHHPTRQVEIRLSALFPLPGRQWSGLFFPSLQKAH